MDFSKKELFEKSVATEIEESLFRLDEEIENNKGKFLSFYKKQLYTILEKIISLQNLDKLERLGAMAIVLNRVNIDNEELTYKIYLYGERMYIDAYKPVFSLEVSDVYKFFLDCKNNLYTGIKKYGGIFEACEVDAELYSYLKYFDSYVVNLLKEVFREAELIALIKKIITTSHFYIIENEFYEKPYLLYQKEKGD